MCFRKLMISYLENGEQLENLIDTLIEISKKYMNKDTIYDHIELIKEDTIFYIINSLFSKDLHNSKYGSLEVLVKKLTEHFKEEFTKTPKEKKSLAILATGGEKTIRTTYVTITVGIICSHILKDLNVFVYGNKAVTGNNYAETNIIENLGYKTHCYSNQNNIDRLLETNFCYLNILNYNPILYRFSEQRVISAFRDIFKLACILSEPYNSEYKFLSLWESKHIEKSLEILKTFEHIEKVLIVSSDKEGYDEFSINGKEYYVLEKENISRKNLELSNKEVTDLKNLNDLNDLNEMAKFISKIFTLEENSNRKKLVLVNSALIISTIKNTDFNQELENIENEIKNGNIKNHYNKILSFEEKLGN